MEILAHSFHELMEALKLELKACSFTNGAFPGGNRTLLVW